MDTSEPSTNGTSASNLFRLSSLLGDDIPEDEDEDEDRKGTYGGGYIERAKETVAAFEAEILQYPWGFGSFMPTVVAERLGVRGVMILEGAAHAGPRSESTAVDTTTIAEKIILSHATSPRGGLSTILKVSTPSSQWLRCRNSLLKDIQLPGPGECKVLVCENGRCREESLELLNERIGELWIGLGGAGGQGMKRGEEMGVEMGREEEGDEEEEDEDEEEGVGEVREIKLGGLTLVAR